MHRWCRTSTVSIPDSCNGAAPARASAAPRRASPTCTDFAAPGAALRRLPERRDHRLAQRSEPVLLPLAVRAGRHDHLSVHLRQRPPLVDPQVDRRGRRRAWPATRRAISARGSAPTKIPSGAHYPQQAATVAAWANWYDTAGPSPAAVNVDGTCTAMTLQRGTQTNGAWSATVTGVGSGCHRYYFSFRRCGGDDRDLSDHRVAGDRQRRRLSRLGQRATGGVRAGGRPRRRRRRPRRRRRRPPRRRRDPDADAHGDRPDAHGDGHRTRTATPTPSASPTATPVPPTPTATPTVPARPARTSPARCDTTAMTSRCRGIDRARHRSAWRPSRLPMRRDTMC